MEIGKIPNSMLQDLIINKIKTKRKEVLLRSKIGEDCCAIDFGDNVCVLSSDPITGAVNEVGKLAVHVSCNDIASCGIEPVGLLVTILAPRDTTEADLDIIMRQLCETADSINVDIIGGHTEITNAVNRVVLITTAVGKAAKDKLVTSSCAQPGDDVLLTKTAGLEGTAIIAHDKEKDLLKIMDSRTIDNAKALIEHISVVKEGVIAGEFGVTSMHDVTEGGVLGAVWEICEASGVGIRLYKERIPIAPETSEITEYFKIDALKLISSGCMLITCKNGNELANKLKGNGVKAEVIGKITTEKTKILISQGKEEEISQPESDELYKVV